MTVVSLNMYQAIAIAAAMLVIGQVLVNRAAFLRRYCIPAPVAFMIVPLVGSLFIDFFNAAIITAFANFLG